MHPTDLSLKQKRALIRREQEAARHLIAQYGEALDRIRREVDGVRDLMDAATEQPLRRRYAERLERLQAADRAIRHHLLVFAHEATGTITGLQESAIGQASEDAPRLMRSALGPGPSSFEFRPPAPDVPLSLVGLSGDGQPLGLLLSEVAGSTAAAVRQELVQGLIRGKGPREVARRVRHVSNISRNRSLLIARTEMLRAYRTTSLSAFRQNPSVVKGWTWQCAYDNRTCAACWAMSGTEHTSEESLNSHPGCRCSMLPRTASWSELGFTDIPDSRPVVERGVDVFARLPGSEQLKILGPGKYAAYKDGRITLPDLVQPTRSARWGSGRRERSLRAALS